jgi:hypothetical protein
MIWNEETYLGQAKKSYRTLQAFYVRWEMIKYSNSCLNVAKFVVDG